MAEIEIIEKDFTQQCSSELFETALKYAGSKKLFL
jgi:hypothetical protein